jgi:hypothetical protein
MPDLNKFRSFVIAKNPNISKEQLAQLDDFVQKQQAVEVVKSGALSLDKIPEDIRVNVASSISPQELEQINVKNSPGSAMKTGAIKVVDDLLSLDTKPITGILQVGAKIPGNPAKLTEAKYKQLKGMLSLENRTMLKGTGTISDYESKLLADASSALDRNLSDEDFRTVLQEVRNVLDPNKKVPEGEGYTDRGAKKTGNPITDALTGNPVTNFLLDKAVNVAQDVGTGIRSAQTGPELEKLNALAATIEEEAMATEDPEQKKALLQNANMIRSQVSGEAGNISKSFSKDVSENPLIRSVLGAGQVASVAEIPALAKSGVNLARNAPKSVKSLKDIVFSKGAGINLRNEVVDSATKAGKTINGSKIAGSIDDWASTAKNAHPSKSKVIDSMVKTVKSQLGGKKVAPNKVFDLWDEANNGFKATSGDAGRTLEASYHRAVRDVVRKELDQVAPGFEKGTKMIAQGMARSEIAKKLGGKTGNAIVGAALYKLLFGGGGGGGVQ